MSEVKGFKLVPASMLLDKDTIEAINFHCGDGDGDDSQFGEYSDGLLWIGAVTDDDGKEVYGLHLATAEYPEEGSATLVEFEAPEDAAQSELAALREELAKATRAREVLLKLHVHLRARRSYWIGEETKAQQRLADAERRNAAIHLLSTEALEVVVGMVEHCLNIRACMGMDEGYKDFENEEDEHDFVKEIRAFVAAALKPTESGASE